MDYPLFRPSLFSPSSCAPSCWWCRDALRAQASGDTANSHAGANKRQAQRRRHTLTSLSDKKGRMSSDVGGGGRGGVGGVGGGGRRKDRGRGAVVDNVREGGGEGGGGVAADGWGVDRVLLSMEKWTVHKGWLIAVSLANAHLCFQAAIHRCRPAMQCIHIHTYVFVCLPLCLSVCLSACFCVKVCVCVSECLYAV